MRGRAQTFQQTRGQISTCIFALLLFVVISGGCSYDYASLGRGRATGGTSGDTGGSIGAAGALGSAGGNGGTGAGVAGAGGVDIKSGTGNMGAAGSDSGSAGVGGSAGSDTTGGSGGGGSGGTGTGSGGTGTGSGGTGTGSGGTGTGSGGTGTGSGGTPASGGIAGGGSAGQGGAGGSLPLVLSVDFIGGRPAATGAGGMVVASPAMDPSEIAGKVPASQWNGAAGPAGILTNLTLSDGSSSTASVTWVSPPGSAGPGVWNHNYTDVPGDVRMMNGYLDPTTSLTPATVVVAGLPATLTASGYDVYVYGSGEITSASTRTCQYSIGTSSSTAMEVGPTPKTFAGYTQVLNGGAGNYLVFQKLTGASFILTAKPGSISPTRAPVNGLQIVARTGN